MTNVSEFPIADCHGNQDYVFLEARFGAARLEIQGASLKFISMYLYAVLPHSSEERDRIFTEANYVREHDSLWALEPRIYGSLEACEEPRFQYTDSLPYTHSIAEMCMLRTRLKRAIEARASLCWITNERFPHTIRYGLVTEACYAITQGTEVSWALDAGDQTDFFVNDSMLRVDVTSAAEYKDRSSYRSDEVMVAELELLDDRTMGNILSRFESKGADVYEEISIIFRSWFRWRLIPVSTLCGPPLLHGNYTRITWWLKMQKVPDDVRKSIEAKLESVHQRRAVFMFDTKFAIIRLRLGVWAEYTTADTYNNYDDKFMLGFNEFEDDEYTVVACNQFQDLIRTKDGIGRESCTITTYDSDHPIQSELTVKGTLPSWFKLALVRKL